MAHDVESDDEVLCSMWPEDIISEAGKRFNIEKPPGPNQDMLEEVTEPSIVDFKRLLDLTNYSEKGSSQLAYLVKTWEHKQANAARLLREELDDLSKQQLAVELKKLEILEEHRFDGDDKLFISILDDDVQDIWQHDVPRRKNNLKSQDRFLDNNLGYDNINFWKHRAMSMENMLEASIQREQILLEKLEESIENLEKQSSPVEELSQILKRADHFLHFVLQNAPVVIGHQDKELRYRFIYNHFPRLGEEEIIGKTDMEIFTGGGVKESQDFKREVLERGLPAKREITFETELFGSKTFLIYVEPVFSKGGETIGVNYMGMDITDQVRKREKMEKLREEIAVQKAMETELNKTIHITEETMRAKEMLATMSHEIRSPLSGVVSIAEILSATKLDKEQRQLLSVMSSSGDLVLQLVNDILDLSKVESGVMKLEATKFRPREVVRHVLQTASASLRKMLTLEGHVSDDVPSEVIGDVLRIRQILTNLISNAIKFTAKGKVVLKLYMVTEPSPEGETQEKIKEAVGVSKSILTDDKSLLASQVMGDQHYFPEKKDRRSPYHRHSNDLKPPVIHNTQSNGGTTQLPETTVWLRCDVIDTGIGIPETALPSLFKKYMQVSADTTRKYGGTGLGLAICKQLVELMGGHITVSSLENRGSTFSFVLPYKVSPMVDGSSDLDELIDQTDNSASDTEPTGYFEFLPPSLGYLFPSNGSCCHVSAANFQFDRLSSCSVISDDPKLRPYESSVDDTCSVATDETPSALDSSSRHKIKSYNQKDASTERLDHGNDSHRSENFEHKNHSSKTRRNVGESTQTRDSTETLKAMEPVRYSDSSLSVYPIHETTSKPSILLVEDNKINVMVTRSMMKQLGYEVDVVNNGAEAVRAVQNGGYDLILMDIYMPVMDGLQATRLIRLFEETGNWDSAAKAGIEQRACPAESTQNCQTCVRSRRIPIIAMTANTLSESADECFANGMDSFITKPITSQTLKLCLQKYLS